MGGYSNPFDQPLPPSPSEVVKTSSNGNPFDEPLPPSPAEAGRAATAPEDKASNTRQMLVSGLTGMPTPNMTDADKASFAKGKAAGAVSVPAVAAGMSLTSAAPVIEAIAEHLPNLDKAYKVLKTLGEVGAGAGGATYTIDHLKQVLGIMGGGSKK